MWYCSKVTNLSAHLLHLPQVCLEICRFLEVDLFTIPHVTHHQVGEWLVTHEVFLAPQVSTSQSTNGTGAGSGSGVVTRGKKKHSRS